MFALDEGGITPFELVDSLYLTLSRKPELFESSEGVFYGVEGAYNLAEQLGTGLGQSGRTQDIIAAAKYAYDAIYARFFPQGSMTRTQWKKTVLEQVMLRIE